MSQTVDVRGLRIGEGKPKICVPVTGRCRAEVLAQAERLPAETQIAEWRADYDEELADISAVLETGGQLAQILTGRDIPLLFTCRSRREGGFSDLPENAYEALSLRVVQSGFADLIDVEYAYGKTRDVILAEAKRCGVRSIVSSHDFAKTDAEEELVRKLSAMAECGADIAKLAVMPETPADVTALLSATARVHERCQVPLITMSMGKLGAVSRICGETFGSAVTFASAEEASAPGQIPVGELARMLEVLRP